MILPSGGARVKGEFVPDQVFHRSEKPNEPTAGIDNVKMKRECPGLRRKLLH